MPRGIKNLSGDLFEARLFPSAAAGIRTSSMWLTWIETGIRIAALTTASER